MPPTSTPEAATKSSPVGANFVERFVDADGFHIRYLEAGTGEPLVLLHGAGGLRLSPAHDLLSRDFRVLAFEMPGFGGSAENTRSTSVRDLAASMASALETLGLEPCFLLGTSFGSRVALWLAIQQPERVRGLVLESPAIIQPEERRSAPPEAGAAQLYAHPERVPPQPPVSPAVLAQQQRLTARLREPALAPELEASMQSLPVPTLVLFGTQDQLFPVQLARRYRELLPHCFYVFVYDAGHAIDMDRPEAFASLVADFLRRGDAFLVNNRDGRLNP